MSEDSRIRRLREFVNLYLRRYKGVNDEEHRVPFLFKESFIEPGKSKISSSQDRKLTRSRKTKPDNAFGKKGNKKISEEIGRSYHTVNNEPYSYDQIHDDLKIEIFPIDGGQRIRAIISNDKESFSKSFATEDEANVWARSKSMELSKNITQ